MNRSVDHVTFKDSDIECNLGIEDAACSYDYNNIRITENAAPGGAHVDSDHARQRPRGRLERCQ